MESDRLDDLIQLAFLLLIAGLLVVGLFADRLSQRRRNRRINRYYFEKRRKP